MLYCSNLAPVRQKQAICKKIIWSFSFCIFTRPASTRSYKIGVGDNNWLVGWFIGNAVFSETALKIFLIFCMKLGTIKAEKSQSRIFQKKSWFGDIRKNVPKLAQNQTLWYFPQKQL